MGFWKMLKKDYNTSSGNPLWNLFGLRPLGKELGLIQELTSLFRLLIYTSGWLS